MKKALLLTAISMFSVGAYANDVTVDMKDLSTGKSIGTVRISESKYGTVFTPNLKGTPSGLHGFHIHANASCDSSTKDGEIIQGGAAGGHYDPVNTGKHGYPWSDDNHLGDLPAIYIDQHGNGTNSVLAPRLKIDDVKGHALMIHVGGDNYSDYPKPLGGGGERLICGEIN